MSCVSNTSCLGGSLFCSGLLVDLNRAGDSLYQGGEFFAEIQRGVRRTTAVGKRVDTCGFYPLVRTAAQASSVRLSGGNPVYQHRLYGIQKAPIPTGTGAFLYKRCKEYVLFGLHIQHADRIEHAQHSHAGIGEYGQPHGCDTEQTED